MAIVFSFSFMGFSDAPAPFTVHLRSPLSDQSCEIRQPLGEPSPCEPPGMRGSACVEVMTTLHGSAPSLRRHAKGCVPSKGMITSARDS